ncbi:hypothetical protein C0992_012449 [Termitomyces sp. T32_za158]|nr:hypothetical protein C0992_012449 [Termitomyces sp. T32_za158]
MIFQPPPTTQTTSSPCTPSPPSRPATTQTSAATPLSPAAPSSTTTSPAATRPVNLNVQSQAATVLICDVLAAGIHLSEWSVPPKHLVKTLPDPSRIDEGQASLIAAFDSSKGRAKDRFALTKHLTSSASGLSSLITLCTVHVLDIINTTSTSSLPGAYQPPPPPPSSLSQTQTPP